MNLNTKKGIWGNVKLWIFSLADNIQEAYNQEENLSEIFYYNLNKMEIPNIENIEDN